MKIENKTCRVTANASTAFVPFPKSEVEQTLPRRFARRVALHSDRIAVSAEDRTLTYAQLDSTANRLAAAIIEKLGTKAEPVVLLFEPGAMMIVAVLAVLKAGKFWVPLTPIERYEERLDERLLPVPDVPDQDIAPWLAALDALHSSRETYEAGI